MGVSSRDYSQFAEATVTVTPCAAPSICVTISPDSALVREGDSFSFSATVTGTSNTAVTWSILEGYGDITDSGLYTAPVGVWGQIHVIATSVADPGANATATLSVQEPALAATNGGVFTEVGNMMTGRVFHTATLLKNGKVLIAGGWNGSQDVTSAELYDPATRTFTPTGSMSIARQEATATLLADGRVLVAGGDSAGPPYTAEIYDPSSGTFARTGDLVPAGGGVSVFFPSDLSTLLPDGRVFVAADNNADIYDPESGTFTLAGPYSSSVTPRYPNTVTLLSTGKVLYNDVYGNELFDPQSGKFSATTPMAKGGGDYGYSATPLLDGTVLFMSGDEDYSEAELYDTKAGTFTSIITTNWSLALAPASRLTDGTVLISGGQVVGGGGSTNAVLYLPASGTFQIPGQMTAPRDCHKSTALLDGTVLLTGGYSFWNWPDPQPVSSAEIYTPH